MKRLTKRVEDGNAVYYLYGFGKFDEICALSECIDRLAAYEDTRLEPEEIKNLKSRALIGALETPEMKEYSGSALERADRLIAEYESIGTIGHLQELAQAEKDGRLVVLPPVSEDANTFQKNLDVFELCLAIKWAHAAVLMDENPDVSRLFFLSEIALNEKLDRMVNGQSFSGQLPRKEAEAALKKREADDER